MSRLIPTYIEQGLRIEQLERELAEAVAKERERCAKVCDEITNSMYWLNDRSEISQDCADAIRKGK